MNAPLWILWLGGTGLPLGAAWLLWRLALRAERCYGYNRALLLLAPAVAAALPLLPRLALPTWLSSTVVAAGPVAVLLPTLAAPAPTAPVAADWSVWNWLLAVYLVGVALGLGRLTWQAGRLHWLARRLPQVAGPGYVLVHTSGQVPTSSFGPFIFWNETTALTPAEAAAVLTHEAAHVRQRHTLDVLWLASWRAVLWPNPFVHLLLPALRLTHELLADRAAATAGEHSAVAYPALLARLATHRLAGPATSSLLQPFTFSFTLTRIAMLQHQIPVRRWKQWLVLPVLGALSLVTGHAASAQAGPVPDKAQAAPKLTEAQKKERLAVISHKLRVAQHQDSLRTGNVLEPGTKQQFHIANWNGPGEPVVTVTRVKIGGPDGTVGIEPNSAGVYTPPPPIPAKQGVTTASASNDGAKVYTYVDQMPQLPGGGYVAAIVQAIQSKVVYPKGAAALTSGRVFASFTVQADGTVNNPHIIKGLTDEFDEAVLTAIRQLPRFEPGKQDGQAVAVSFTVPISFVPKP